MKITIDYSIFTISFLILLSLKLLHIITWSWWLVFLPLLIPLVIGCILFSIWFVLHICGESRMDKKTKKYYKF